MAELTDKRLQKGFRTQTVTEEYGQEDVKIKDLMKQASLEQKAFVPEKVPEVFKATPAGTPVPARMDFPFSQMLREEEPYLYEPSQEYTEERRQWASQWSDAFETAYHYYGGKLPTSWLITQDPQDLEMLRTGDYQLDDQVVDALIEGAEQYRPAQQLHAQQHEQFREQVENRTNGLFNLSSFVSKLRWMPGTLGQAARAADPTGELSSLDRETDMETIRQAVRNELIEESLEWTSNPTNEERGNIVMNALATGFQWVGDQVDYGTEAFLGGLGVDATLNRHDREAAAFERAKVEAEEMRGNNQVMAEIAQTHGFRHAQDIWERADEMEETMPGYRGELIEMANGDEMLAGLLFAQEILDMQEVEDQVELGQEIHDAQIQMLREEDFQVSGATLNLMAAYDKFVPSTLATGFFLLWSDDELRSDFLTGRLGEFYDEIQDMEHKPSNVFGIDGTAAGLGLDFFGSWVFDPINVAFAAPGRRAAGRAYSMKMAESSASRGWGKQVADEIVDAIVDDDWARRDYITGWIYEADPNLADELVADIARTSKDKAGWKAVDLDPDTGKALEDLAGADPQKLKSSGLESKDVRQTLASKADYLGEQTSAKAAVGTPMRKPILDLRAKVTSKDGTDYFAHFIPDDGSGGKALIWKNEDGYVGGMFAWHPEGGGGMLNRFGGGVDLTGESIDALRVLKEGGNKEVADALLAMSRDNAITEAGAKSIQRGAQKLLDEATDFPAVVRDAIGERAQDVIRRAILKGGDPGSMRKKAIWSAMGDKIGSALRDGKLNVVWRNAHPNRLTAVHMRVGPQAYKRASENIHFLWGSNRGKANAWAKELMDARRAAVQRADDMASDPAFHKFEAIANQLDNLDNNLKTLDRNAPDMDLDDANDMSIVMGETKDVLEAEYHELQGYIAKKYGSEFDTGIDKVMNDMWEDYNRNVIAKNPIWKDKVGTDGLVPWEEIKVTGITPDPKSIKGFEGMDDIEDVKRLSKMMDTLYGAKGNNFTTPVSPMDLLVAGQASPSAYVKLVKEGAAAGFRNSALTAHRMWVMDKVARISTAAVVSFDELMRVFHRYGYEAMIQYMTDRAIFLGARSKNLLKRGRLDKNQGMDFMSEASKKRHQALMDYPDYITEAERLTWEKLGQNVAVIRPGEAGYVNAAREYYRQFTNEPVFQNFLKGEDQFRSWWFSDAGSSARRMTVDVPGEGKRLATWEEVYQGQQTVMNAITRNVPKAKQNEVIKAIQDAADDAAQGGQGYMAPHVFEYTPSVRGYQRAGFKQDKSLFGGALDFMMDKFFMEPTNYRRGMLFNMARDVEVDRLYKLYADQGLDVLTDQQVLRQLGLPSHTSLSQLPSDVFDQLALKEGMITHRHIKNMAESKAVDELEDMFFAWDQGTRLGNAGRGIAPFIGPWADMWGFWGREMMQAPVLRGGFNENQFWQSSQNLVNKMPFNPKTMSMVSRLANTDFSITEGLGAFGMDEGPDVDISPLFFFPTQGEHAFQTLLPGLGIIPSTFIDVVLENEIDPLEDPEGYQRLVDSVSQILPQVQYTTGDPRSDILGGGNIASLYKVASGLYSALEEDWASSAWLGDYSADIDMNRNVSVNIAENMDDLLSITDPDMLEQEILGLVVESQRTAGIQQAGQQAIRLTVPARVDFDVAAEELQMVWADWAKDIDLEVRTSLQNPDLDDPEQLRQYADEVRGKFFDMPQEERNWHIFNNPQLAVNLVSNWTWSDKASTQLGRETLLPYSSGGSDEDLARHQTYVERGLVQPRTPKEKAYLILGTISRARKSVVQSTWEGTVGKINEMLWRGLVPENTKGTLTAFLTQYGDVYGMEPGDEERLWQRWGSYEDDFEGQLLADVGLDPESDEAAELLRDINIPVKERAWSPTYPGNRGPSKKLAGFPIGLTPVDDQTIEQMSALGIEWDENLTGEQFFQGLHNEYQVSPGFTAEIDGPFRKWLDDAAAAPSAAEAGLMTMANNDRYSEEFRDRVQEFRILEAEIAEDEAVRGIPLKSDMDRVRTAWRNLMVISEEEGAMERWWKDSYEKRYGPLDWEPPVPPRLFDDEGNQTPNSYEPRIRKVTDGDTLVVTNYDDIIIGSVPDGLKEVRLLGVRARDFGLDNEGANEDRQKLTRALLDAERNGDRIYLVRDPEQFGSSTDKYGRELAWLYIGEEPWYFDDAFLPTDD